ncbi:LppU/SCO3897 family protein [Actinomadura vinacea]
MGPMGPMGPPPQRKGPGRLIGLLIAGGVAAIVLLAIAGVVVANLASGEPDGPVQAEHCIDVRGEMNTGSGFMQRIPAATRVGCKSDQAKGKVLKVVRTGQRTSFSTSSMPECPDGADGVARVTISEKDERYWEVCTRNLAAPHPGDPGAGGGMIGAGDCISNSLAFSSEKPCSGSEWYGKIIARVATQSQCPAGRTMETAKLSGSSGSTSRPVLCLGAGGAVLGPGDCIADTTFSFNGPRKVECSGSDAFAKVTGRVRTQRECPSGSNKFLEAKDAYLPVLCLRQLKPTLKEQLDSLPG